MKKTKLMSCVIIRHNAPIPQIKNSFTIIELLIVITIIAILAGMLLPTLAQAREKGKAISCVSNIHQLSTALASYTSDYDGHFVPGKSDGAWGDANLKRWHGSRVNTTSAFQPNGPLMAYLGNSQKVKECPNTPSINRDASSGAFEAGGGGYGYNCMYLEVENICR